MSRLPAELARTAYISSAEMCSSSWRIADRTTNESVGSRQLDKAAAKIYIDGLGFDPAKRTKSISTAKPHEQPGATSVVGFGNSVPW